MAYSVETRNMHMGTWTQLCKSDGYLPFGLEHDSVIITSTVFQPRGEQDTGWWMTAAVTVVITAATIIGNMTVMVVICRMKRAPSHYPLMSLVIADMLVGFAVQPIAVARELFFFNLDPNICAFWSTMDVLCCTASILSLCALGWERYSGITAPFSRLRRSHTSKLLAYSVWPVATLVALPDAFIPSPHHYHPGEMEMACTVNINIGYVFFSITCSFYLPAVVMLVLYGYILKALSAKPVLRAYRGRSPCFSHRDDGERYTQRITAQLSLKCHLSTTAASRVDCTANSPNYNAHEAFIQRQRRATRIIVMLMALFLICWTPYFIILPLDSLFDCVRETTWLWCTWLGYANSALNPLVYVAVLRPGSASARSSRNIELPLGHRP